jgi:ankyrin repeat protein
MTPLEVFDDITASGFGLEFLLNELMELKDIPRSRVIRIIEDIITSGKFDDDAKGKLRLLQKRGLDFTKVCADNSIPVTLFAIKHKNLDALMTLIDMGFEVNGIDSEEDTVLHHLARNEYQGHLAGKYMVTIRSALSSGVSLTAANKKGLSPLRIARDHSNIKHFIRLTLRCGAILDEEAITSVVYASQGYADLDPLMSDLKNGKVPSRNNGDNETAFTSLYNVPDKLPYKVPKKLRNGACTHNNAWKYVGSCRSNFR